MYYADGCIFEYRGNFCADFHKGVGCAEYIVTEHVLSHECPDCTVNVVVGETDDVLENTKVHELEGKEVYKAEFMEMAEREMFGEVADMGIHELDGTCALGLEGTAVTYAYPPDMHALEGMMSLISLVDDELTALDASSTIQDLEPPYTPDSMMMTEDTDSNPFSDSDVWSVVEGTDTDSDSDSVHSYASSDLDEVFPEEPLCLRKATLRPLECPNSGEMDHLDLGPSYGWSSFTDSPVGSASDDHSMECSVADYSTCSSVNRPSPRSSLKGHGGSERAVSLATKLSIVEEEEDEEDEEEAGGVPL